MAGGILAGVNPNDYPDSIISGVVLTDIPEADVTEAGIIQVITETQDTGAAANGARWLSNLTEPPGYTESDTIVEPFSDLYGKSGDLVNETITRMVRSEATVSFGSLSLENLKLIRPDMAFTVVMSTGATPVPVAVRAERTLETNIEQYKTLVIAYSTGDQLIGKAMVIKNAKSVTEDMEWSLDNDYTVQGVSATLRGHSTGADIDPLTGKTAPSAYILDFTRTAVPA